jgi:hypothetical protein
MTNKKQIYKVISNDGLFAAFWQDHDTISFFVPSNEYVMNRFSTPMTAFSKGELFIIEGDNNPDAVFIDSALNYLAQMHVHINKSTVALSTVKAGIYYPRIWRGHSVENNPFSN